MLEPKDAPAAAATTSADAAVALKRVLIAEDDEETNDCLVQALVENGFEVASARDGSAALRYLDDARFDAVVLDLVMPGAGGMSVMDEIQKRGLATPVIVISNYLGALDRQRYVRFGAARVFSKPFSFDELVAAVRQVTGAA